MCLAQFQKRSMKLFAVLSVLQRRQMQLEVTVQYETLDLKSLLSSSSCFDLAKLKKKERKSRKLNP